MEHHALGAPLGRIAVDYRLLEWDTQFFGFRVASIRLERVRSEQLEAVLARLRSREVRLAYWASDPADRDSQHAAQANGGVLVDRKTTFVIDLRSLAPDNPKAPSTVVAYTAKTPGPDLERLAVQSGLYSRFRVDPRIGRDRFEKLYKLWVANSTRGNAASAVMVFREAGRIRGMITLGEKDGRGSIGLMAVDEGVRRRGIGTALLQAANGWFRAHGCTEAEVVTQGENRAACRFYEKCGYLVEKVSNFYHFWLEGLSSEE